MSESAIPKSIRLEPSEWEHLEVLAEHAGKSTHGYCVAIVRAHLEANPIDEETLEEITRMREEFARRRAARMARTRTRRKTHRDGENGLVSPSRSARSASSEAA